MEPKNNGNVTAGPQVEPVQVEKYTPKEPIIADNTNCIKYFNEKCPNGTIATTVEYMPEWKIVVNATIIPNSKENLRTFNSRAYGDLADIQTLEFKAVKQAIALMGFVDVTEVTV